MGLGAPKRRNKLAQDPNNTQWSKSTSGFGHKILSQQGWKPGDYLGASNASHSDHYTAANASHIRVLLREDNLGLGAQVGKGNAETFGLSLFSGVLGRLNGKSEGEVQKQQDALRDAELRVYSDRKFGGMEFVRGGFLVGDRIQETADREATAVRSVAAGDTDHKMKKRGAEDSTGSRKKKRKVEGEEEPPEAKNEVESEEPKTSDDEESRSKKKAKKSKKKSESSRKSKTAGDSATTIAEDDRARRKQERRARKEERRRRKEEKRKSRSKSTATDSTSQTPKDTDTSGQSTPQPSAALAGRNAVRQRYIQSKRMASMDPKAMKEIFMLPVAAQG